MSTKKFSHVSIQETESVKSYLNSLVEALEQKKITLSSGDENLVMNMGDLCRLSIQAKKKDSEYKLAIKLSWTENGQPSDLSQKEVAIS